MAAKPSLILFSDRAPQWKSRDRKLTIADASFAVHWLNISRGTKAYRRVLAVRKELEDLGAMIGVMGVKKAARPHGEQKLLDDLGKEAKQVGWIKTMQRLHEKLRRRHNALNRVLSRYSFAPALAYGPDLRCWRFNTVPTRKRTSHAVVRWEHPSGIKLRVDEAGVVAALARLATREQLDTVHLCSNCRQRWVVSVRRRNQVSFDKFCSEECRRDFHVHSQTGKDEHRDAQKKHRNSPGYKIAHPTAPARNDGFGDRA